MEPQRHIAGATSSSTSAGSPGDYTCRVTATNQAGSASQTSALHAVLTPPTKATISALRATNSVFAVAASSTPVTGRTAVARHKKGTVYSFGLDQPATVKIAIQTKPAADA